MTQKAKHHTAIIVENTLYSKCKSTTQNNYFIPFFASSSLLLVAVSAAATIPLVLLAIESVIDKEPLNYAEWFCFCATYKFLPRKGMGWIFYSFLYSFAGFSTTILYSVDVEFNKWNYKRERKRLDQQLYTIRRLFVDHSHCIHYTFKGVCGQSAKYIFCE